MKAYLKFDIGPGGEDKYDFACAVRASKLNGAIWDALQIIRERLKYGEDVSDKEQEVLERIREELSSEHVEEC